MKALSLTGLLGVRQVSEAEAIALLGRTVSIHSSLHQARPVPACAAGVSTWVSTERGPPLNGGQAMRKKFLAAAHHPRASAIKNRAPEQGEARRGLSF